MKIKQQQETVTSHSHDNNWHCHASEDTDINKDHGLSVKTSASSIHSYHSNEMHTCVYRSHATQSQTPILQDCEHNQHGLILVFPVRPITGPCYECFGCHIKFVFCCRRQRNLGQCSQHLHCSDHDRRVPTACKCGGEWVLCPVATCLNVHCFPCLIKSPRDCDFLECDLDLSREPHTPHLCHAKGMFC